jgi:hypothetical protein
MEKKPIYYEMTPVYRETNPMAMTTAACVLCSLCGKIASGMGGPGNAPVCVECFELAESQQLMGCVVYGESEGFCGM